MLSRVRAPVALLPTSQNRAYSYFSQRPGRFFTAHNASAASSSSQSGRRAGKGLGAPRGVKDVKSTSETSADGAAVALKDPSASAEHADTTSSGASASPSTPSEQSVSPADASDASSSPSTRFSSLPPTAPLFHPQPPLPSLHLHQFFSQHRPLLLLDQPMANLFSPLQSSSSASVFPTSPNATAALSDAQAQIEDEATARALAQLDFDTSAPQSLSHSGRHVASSEDADADVARVLARALVVQRIESSQKWGSVMKQLGLKAEELKIPVALEGTEDAVVSLDSVKRKRRKKMNKHKFKKRRKLQRAERRRLGK